MSEESVGNAPPEGGSTGREHDHQRRNYLQGELMRRTIERLRQARAARAGLPPAAQTVDQRTSERRGSRRGGRRSGDRRLPWWRTGLYFAALCAILRCWRVLRRSRSRFGGAGPSR